MALQTLAEVPKIGYEKIHGYLEGIGNLTQSFLQQGKNTQLKYSLIFWNNLC